MRSTNRVIISAAGSGKTTSIVKEAISKPQSKIAIVTYTINNVSEIRKKFYELHGSIPTNVIIMSWFTFMLQECARPYSNFVYDKHRIESIAFVNGRSAQFAKKNNTERYFFSENKIYTDKISEFALICNEKSNGLVISRLNAIFDNIYIDEVQDLAGYDLDLIELFLRSKINMLLVGDNRQATYSTNNSARNKKYQGDKIIDLFGLWVKQNLCEQDYLSQSYRCNQSICDLADRLYPEMPITLSQNREITGHDGIFLIPDSLIEQYISIYSPKILRYDKRTNCNGQCAINFGDSKGLTFPRVLIFPNNPIKEYLLTGDIEKVRGSRAKLYVAITRAKYSVAFAYSGQCQNKCILPWSPI